MSINLILIFCLYILPGLMTECTIMKGGKGVTACAEKEMEMGVIFAKIITHCSLCFRKERKCLDQIVFLKVDKRSINSCKIERPLLQHMDLLGGKWMGRRFY